jgi:hypothetical protein
MQSQGCVKEGPKEIGITMFIPQFEVSRQVLAMFFAIKNHLDGGFALVFSVDKSGVLQ